MNAVATKLRVEIYGIGLPIWRTFTVYNGIYLSELNSYLVRMMGWGETSMYDYFVKELDLKTVDQDIRPGIRIINPDYSRIRLSRIGLKKGTEFRFTQKTHRSLWIHTIIVEEFYFDSSIPKHPICIDGFGKCPPRVDREPFDFMHYYNLLNAADPESVAKAREWFDQDYVHEQDIELKIINADLKKLWDIYRERDARVR